MQILFWLSAGLVLFHYCGYPLLMALMAKLKTEQGPSPLEELPPVTLIISVYNEAGVIRQRLENCRQLEYPRDRLQILVISDGSTDCTHAIVRQYADHGVELRVVPGRVGKTEALNQVIPSLKSEILVFSDANSMLRPDALLRLVQPFADSRIGAVCGELRLSGDAGAEGAYWRYEQLIKQYESKVSTLTVVNGALYGLRRKLHQSMNPRAANDFQHPIQVALQRYKTVYVPAAVAVEQGGATESVEARRRVRIISRGWRGLGSNRQVLNPFRAGLFTFQFIARKLLRWLGPIFLLATLTANAFLSGQHLFYRVAFAAQILFYALALLGFVLNRYGRRFLPAYLPYYFCLINWSALVALGRVVRGADSAVWTPTTGQKPPG